MGNDTDSDAVTFHDGHAWLGDQSIPFSTVATTAWAKQISLSSTGYATPGIGVTRVLVAVAPFSTMRLAGLSVKLRSMLDRRYRARVDILMMW